MGKRPSGRIPQPQFLRIALPNLEVMEPMAGDFAILQPSEYLPVELEEKFQNLYREAILEGIFCKNEWTNWCNACRIPTSVVHENTFPINGEALLPLSLMSDIAEDLLPHLGLFISELLWGERPQNASVLNGAIASTLPILPHGHCPLSKIGNQKPRLDKIWHNSLTAHYRTPTSIWTKSNNHYTSLLSIAEQYLPENIENQEILPDIFIGKMIFLQDGSCHGHLVHPINKISSHCIDYIEMRLLLEWYRYRRHNYNITYEDILRERADVVYRAFSEYESP